MDAVEILRCEIRFNWGKNAIDTSFDHSKYFHQIETTYQFKIKSQQPPHGISHSRRKKLKFKVAVYNDQLNRPNR